MRKAKAINVSKSTHNAERENDFDTVLNLSIGQTKAERDGEVG